MPGALPWIQPAGNSNQGAGANRRARAFTHGIAVPVQGKANAGDPAPDWPAIVFYGWTINLSKGDTVVARFDRLGSVELPCR